MKSLFKTNNDILSQYVHLDATQKRERQIIINTYYQSLLCIQYSSLFTLNKIDKKTFLYNHLIQKFINYPNDLFILLAKMEQNLNRAQNNQQILNYFNNIIDLYIALAHDALFTIKILKSQTMFMKITQFLVDIISKYNHHHQTPLLIRLLTYLFIFTTKKQRKALRQKRETKSIREQVLLSGNLYYFCHDFCV